MEMDNCNEKVNPLLLVIGGAIVGSTVALLFAPQSGEQTRSDVRKLGELALNSAERFQSELRDQVSDLINAVVDRTGRDMEQGQAMTEKVRGEVVATLESGCRVLEEEISSVRQRFQ
jgi:gas vesicle protein